MGNQGLGGGRFRLAGNWEDGKGMRRFGQPSLCARVPGSVGFSPACRFAASFFSVSHLDV
jgi:hypothetical protein